MRPSILLSALVAVLTAAGVKAWSRPLVWTTDYTGGKKSVDETGHDFTQQGVDTGVFYAKVKICDFVVIGHGTGTGGSGSSGITINSVSVTVVGQSGQGPHFKVDDNRDGQLQSGENDSSAANPTVDQEVRSISDSLTNCIDVGQSFKLNIKGTNTNNSGTIDWQATAPTSTNGQGGPLVAATTSLAPNTAAVSPIYNPFNILGISLNGVNSDTSSILSVGVDTPSGIGIVSAVSLDNPGTWNSATNVFTFDAPIESQGTLDLQIMIDGFDTGVNTNIGWHANY